MLLITSIQQSNSSTSQIPHLLHLNPIIVITMTKSKKQAEPNIIKTYI